MKTFLSLQGILLCMFFSSNTSAQCSAGSTAYSITYDTVVYNSGSGNYSSSYSFSFPKFNIPLGTFIGADISSSVSIGYNYTITNTDTKSNTYKTRIYRNDDITSTALDPSDISATNSSSQITTVLTSGQVYNYGPALTTYTINNTIGAADTRLINFMGVGTVDFDYDAFTYAFISSPTGGPGNVNIAAAKDTTRFSITYRYCMTTLLPANLLFFSAAPLAKGKVLLSWRQANIENGRQYNLQVSTDGRSFKNITSVNENSTGNYAYTYFHNATTRLYFRIEEKEISGETKYSEVRIIDPTPQEVVHIYPTLYTGGSLQVDFPYQADWLINVYSAEGRKILEEKRKNSGGSTQLTLPNALSNGTYTAEFINLQTQQKQFARIIVQR